MSEGAGLRVRETDADVVIIGGGASGLSLAHALATSEGAGSCSYGSGKLSVALVEAPEGPLRPAERTWCFWEEAAGEFDDAVTASWGRLRVHGPDGHVSGGGLGRLRYKMIRSAGFEQLVHARLADLEHVRLLRATAHEVRATADAAEVRCTTADGRAAHVRGRIVYDSRPLPSLPPARTTLLQHFRGWFVRTRRPAFDPEVADLMDFRVPQPPHGLAFGYVLPLGPRDALVEYTRFSRAPLSRESYDRALRHYTTDVLRLGALEIRDAEQGVIPMTDARFPRHAGAGVFRIGAAGGATRPATGYTFSASRRQTGGIAAALRAGRSGAVPAPWSRRAMAMDAVMLRALDTGRVDGPRFFSTLFRRTPPEQLLRFLDGRTGLFEDLRIGFAVPMWPMLRTALELPFLPRRPAGASRTAIAQAPVTGASPP
ncbi:lycopene cyclase family protein [Streptomyces sp. NPDC096193]|uniref:lycopene cyclase family protein n=1 Tax=Streptomyces sp. NPDC096193 TaxID=3155821 RepID=UPI0033284802